MVGTDRGWCETASDGFSHPNSDHFTLLVRVFGNCVIMAASRQHNQEAPGRCLAENHGIENDAIRVAKAAIDLVDTGTNPSPWAGTTDELAFQPSCPIASAFA